MRCDLMCMRARERCVDVRLMHVLLFAVFFYLLALAITASLLAGKYVWCIVVCVRMACVCRMPYVVLTKNRKFVLIGSHFIYTDSLNWQMEWFPSLWSAWRAPVRVIYLCVCVCFCFSLSSKVNQFV